MAHANSAVAEITAHAESWNMRLLGHSDLAGHGDGSRIDKEGNFLYVAHMKSMAGSRLKVVKFPQPDDVKQSAEAARGTRRKRRTSGASITCNALGAPSQAAD